MGITAGSREVPGRNVCDKRHPYRITIIIIIIIIWAVLGDKSTLNISISITIGKKMKNSAALFIRMQIIKSIIHTGYLSCEN